MRKRKRGGEALEWLKVKALATLSEKLPTLGVSQATPIPGDLYPPQGDTCTPLLTTTFNSSFRVSNTLHRCTYTQTQTHSQPFEPSL